MRVKNLKIRLYNKKSKRFILREFSPCSSEPIKKIIIKRKNKSKNITNNERKKFIMRRLSMLVGAIYKKKIKNKSLIK